MSIPCCPLTPNPQTYLYFFFLFQTRCWLHNKLIDRLILTAPIHFKRSIGEQEMQCEISSNLFPSRIKLFYLDSLRVSTSSFWLIYSFNCHAFIKINKKLYAFSLFFITAINVFITFW